MTSGFRVAAYIRLSREDGDKAESDSIGNQRKLIAEYLKEKEDLEIYDTYIDDGFSAPAASLAVFLIAAGTATARITAAVIYAAIYFFCSMLCPFHSVFTKIYESKTALMPDTERGKRHPAYCGCCCR